MVAPAEVADQAAPPDLGARQFGRDERRKLGPPLLFARCPSQAQRGLDGFQVGHLRRRRRGGPRWSGQQVGHVVGGGVGQPVVGGEGPLDEVDQRRVGVGRGGERLGDLPMGQHVATQQLRGRDRLLGAPRGPGCEQADAPHREAVERVHDRRPDPTGLGVVEEGEHGLVGRQGTEDRQHPLDRRGLVGVVEEPAQDRGGRRAEGRAEAPDELRSVRQVPRPGLGRDPGDGGRVGRRHEELHHTQPVAGEVLLLDEVEVVVDPVVAAGHHHRRGEALGDRALGPTSFERVDHGGVLLVVEGGDVGPDPVQLVGEAREGAAARHPPARRLTGPALHRHGDVGRGDDGDRRGHDALPRDQRVDHVDRGRSPVEPEPRPDPEHDRGAEVGDGPVEDEVPGAAELGIGAVLLEHGPDRRRARSDEVVEGVGGTGARGHRPDRPGTPERRGPRPPRPRRVPGRLVGQIGVGGHRSMLPDAAAGADAATRRRMIGWKRADPPLPCTARHTRHDQES